MRPSNPFGLMPRIACTLGASICALAGHGASAARDWHVGDFVEASVGHPPIRCEITSEKSSYKPGNHPVVAVRLINDTRQVVNLVGSLDNSEPRDRYPYAYFEVLGPPDGTATASVFSCGNINELRDDDFIELFPGGRLDPFMRIDDGGYFPPYQFEATTLAKPGTYTITFHYSTDSDDPSEWHAVKYANVAGFTKVNERLRLVPRVTISCSVQVQVSPW